MSAPVSLCVLQASDILRRIERFLNTDNDPDADTFLLCYSALGSSDGGKWCCDDATYVTFEQVVDLWQVGSRSRCAGAASLATVSRLPAEQRRAKGRPSSDCLRRRLLQRPLGAEGAACGPCATSSCKRHALTPRPRLMASSQRRSSTFRTAEAPLGHLARSCTLARPSCTCRGLAGTPSCSRTRMAAPTAPAPTCTSWLTRSMCIAREQLPLPLLPSPASDVTHAPGRHVVSAAQPSTSALKRLAPDPPSPPPTALHGLHLRQRPRSRRRWTDCH